MIQIIYPFVSGILFIFYMVNFLTDIKFTRRVLIERVSSDWHNTYTEFAYPELNYGNQDSIPFNDLIVLDANLTDANAVNECPTFDEHIHSMGEFVRN